MGRNFLNIHKMGKDLKKKKKRSTSNVFSQFEQQQIQEFKEAFQMIDADRNGIITVGDLKATYASLGVRDCDQDMLEKMVSEAGAPINFTIFLNMLADKLHGTDPEDVIVKAFKVFDKLNSMFDICEPDDAGMLDYKSLCYTLTHGSSEE